MNLEIKQLLSSLGVESDKSLVELLEGSSISLIIKIAGLACAQLFTFVIARLLGADAYGIFSLCLGILTIASIIGTAGLDIGLLRLIASDSAKQDKEGVSTNYISSLITVVPLSVMISIVIFQYSNLIANVVFDKPDLAIYFRIASFGVLPFTLIKINTQGLRGFKDITKFAFLNFVSRYLFALILLFPFYFFSHGNRIVILAYVVSLVIIALLSFYWILKKIDYDFIYITAGRYIKLIKISAPLMLASSLLFVKGWIDILMLGYYMDNSDVGIYNISLKLAGLIGLTLTAVNIIAAPKFAELYGKGDLKALSKAISQSTKLIFYSSIPFLIVFVLFPDLILTIFGDDFKEGSTALIILSIGFFVNSLAGSVAYLMQMTGKQIAFQNITLMTAFLGILLNYLLIPVWGINGAAISTSIGLVFWNIACAAYLKVRYGLTTYYNPFSGIHNE